MSFVSSLTESEIHELVVEHEFTSLFPRLSLTTQIPKPIISIITNYSKFDKFKIFDDDFDVFIDKHELFPNIDKKYFKCNIDTFIELENYHNRSLSFEYNNNSCMLSIQYIYTTIHLQSTFSLIIMYFELL